MSKVTAIIGHGRSPEGKGWADLINGCDVVLRMWDHTWQDPQDYGTKYDVGFFEIGDSLVKAFNQHNKRHPSLGWVASYLGFTKLPIPDNTEVISQLPWTFEAKRMGGIGATGNLEFTRGTIATLHTISRSQPNDTVICVGFDNVVANKQLPLDEAFSPVYRANAGSLSFNGYKGNVSKYGNHDFEIERPIMERLAARHGVELKFTNAEWPLH